MVGDQVHDQAHAAGPGGWPPARPVRPRHPARARPGSGRPRRSRGSSRFWPAGSARCTGATRPGRPGRARPPGRPRTGTRPTAAAGRWIEGARPDNSARPWHRRSKPWGSELPLHGSGTDLLISHHDDCGADGRRDRRRGPGRRVTPTEVLEEHLERIEALDGRLGAFLPPGPRRSGPRRGPWKTEVTGRRWPGCRWPSRTASTWPGADPRGSAATSPEPAADDAELVRRLRGRGAAGRQDQPARAGPVAVHRERGLRRHLQPLEPRPQRRRLLGRQRRRGRLGHGPHRPGRRRGRLDPHARLQLRPGRHQARARRGPVPGRRPSALCGMNEFGPWPPPWPTSG